MLDEDEAMDTATSESMNDVEMIPSSQEAIKSLKKMDPEINETKRPSTCREELDGGSEISIMPCKHLCHEQCIMH